MHMKSLLHFTENHRFCVYRDFCLSSLDSRMLSSVYQPMVGAFAISLYHLLFQQIPIEKLGYSPLEQQRRLFLTLGLEPSEKGHAVPDRAGLASGSGRAASNLPHIYAGAGGLRLRIRASAAIVAYRIF